MNIYERLMKLRTTPNQRAFLDSVEKGWYVETEPDCDGMVQSGNVVGIIRDRFHVPVCLRIQNEDGLKDCISVDHIGFFEPSDGSIANYYEYDENLLEDTDRILTGRGFIYCEEDCCWRNPVTGEEECI